MDELDIFLSRGWTTNQRDPDQPDVNLDPTMTTTTRTTPPITTTLAARKTLAIKPEPTWIQPNSAYGYNNNDREH